MKLREEKAQSQTELLEGRSQLQMAALGMINRQRASATGFLGPYAPEPLGDYFAGPNHVLPTLGTARFSSALSVQTFCKRTSIIAASPAFAAANADAVARLARMEQLEAHARSMECRKQ